MLIELVYYIGYLDVSKETVLSKFKLLQIN